MRKLKLFKIESVSGQVMYVAAEHIQQALRHFEKKIKPCKQLTLMQECFAVVPEGA